MHKEVKILDLIRIGEKLISKSKINKAIEDILIARQSGLSQSEVAKKMGIDRSFISRIESLGELRKGKSIGLIGFPILNVEELKEVAEKEGVDFVLLMNDRERWEFIYRKSGIELLNEIMEIISKVRSLDAVIILGSDQRIRLFRALLDNEVVAVEIGKSPMKEDVYFNKEELRTLIKNLKEA